MNANLTSAGRVVQCGWKAPHAAPRHPYRVVVTLNDNVCRYTVLLRLQTGYEYSLGSAITL